MLNGNDYYPFGMVMPGRKFSSTTNYRYGFNGKEEDDEVKGDGNQQDYGMRIYDPRLGRFLSVDPLIHEYPELTPYQFASNRPIIAVDLDGLEAKDLYREIEPVRQQRKIESAFGIVHKETRGQKAVRYFVTGGLGFVVLAPVIAEAPALLMTTSSRLFWWVAANPQTASGVAFTILVAASGYEGPDLPGPSDDFGKMGRKVYNKLMAAGINSKDALGQASRNSYNAIIGTIDSEIKGIKTWKDKALKAFEIRNNAKDFAREMSGPELKEAAEMDSKSRYKGNSYGKSFEDMFKTYKDAGKNDDEAYQEIIKKAKSPSVEKNSQYGSN